jgi:hypothetical protein
MRSSAELDRPYRLPDPAMPYIALPDEEQEDEENEEGMEEEEEGHPEPAPIAPPPSRRYRKKAMEWENLKLEHLEPCHIAVIQDWMQSDNVERTFHAQVRDIGNALVSMIPPVSDVNIGQIFGIKRGTVWSHINEAGWTGNGRGQQPMFSREEEEEMKAYVLQRMDENAPAGFIDLMAFADTHFGKNIHLDSIRHWVHRCQDLKEVDGHPQETVRLNCNPQEIDGYYDDLDRILHDFPAALVINLDETGHQEWADRTDQRVVVPESYEGDSIDIPINRASKRSTLLGAITADGFALDPMVIMHRGTIEREVYQTGYIPTRVMFAQQENGFIDTNLFNLWCREKLFPYVERKREELGYYGEALVLIDGCSAHYGDYFLDEVTFRGVHIVSSHRTRAIKHSQWTWESSLFRRSKPVGSDRMKA